MELRAVPEGLAEGLALLHAALDRIAAAGIELETNAEAIATIKATEQVARRMDSLMVDVMDAVDTSGLHRIDGHASAKTMVAHHAKLSGAEAMGRYRTMKLLREVPEFAAAYRAGEVGRCQVRRLSLAHANPRVRDKVGDSDGWFLHHATKHGYRLFAELVSDWVRILDEDGARQANDRNHANRTSRLRQEFDLSWRWEGGCGALQGAEMSDIQQHFIDAEWRIEWEKVVAEHGDDATVDLMPRTEAQRRCDALLQIHRQAARAHSNGRDAEIVTNVVIDQHTFERQLASLAGAEVEPDDPRRDGYRCSTLDGIPLEPTEAVAHALIASIRRAVVGADSVVTDLGRRRLFTGSARLAVQLSASECYWPGCHVPVSRCQIDHLEPYARRPGTDRGGGRTETRNGGPGCRRHNRFKERGYTVHRDPTGTITITRPDGTRLE